MWKKHIAKLLVFAMVLSLLPFAAAVDGEETTPADGAKATGTQIGDYVTVSDVKVATGTNTTADATYQNDAFVVSSETKVPVTENKVKVSFTATLTGAKTVTIKQGATALTVENGLTIKDNTYTVSYDAAVTVADGQGSTTFSFETQDPTQTKEITVKFDVETTEPMVASIELSGTGVTTGTDDGYTASLEITDAATEPTLTLSAVPKDASGNAITNATIEWASSAPGVATVANGTVTAQSAGTASITATCDSATATCTVTVTDSRTAEPTITLDKSEATITVNQEFSLVATSNGSVTWNSADTSYVTVSDAGVIKGIKVTETPVTVTATATVGSKTAKAECKVTVKAADAENDPAVSLGEPALALDLSGTRTGTLTATITNGKTIEWTSNDETVAKVTPSADKTSATVEAFGVGEAEITVTVTAENGVSANAKCTVSVTDSKVSVTGVTLSGDKTVEEGKTVTLTPTITPADATNKDVTWKSGDDTIATVDQKGVVTGVKAGKTTITVTTVDGGKTAELQIEVTAKATEPEKPAAEYTVKVNFDPAEGGKASANVEKAKEGDEIVVTIETSEGYMVDSITNNDVPEKLPDGNYTFKMPAKNVIVVVRFVKVEIEAKAEPTAPAEVEVGAGIDPTDKEKVEEAAKASTMDAGDAARDAALEIAKAETDDDKKFVEAARSAKTLEDLGLKPDEVDKVEIVVQPKVSYKPATLTGMDSGKPVYKLEIDGWLQVQAKAKEGGNGKSVPLGRKDIVDQPVELKVKLPFELKEPPFAGHRGKWQYTTRFVGGLCVFTNPHGFSPFEISTEDQTVATIKGTDGYTYLTLAAAAEDAKTGDTLTIKKTNSESVKLEKGVKVKLDKDVKFDGKINGSNVTFDENGEYVVKATSSGDNNNNNSNTGGGGGGGGSSKPAIKPGADTNKPTTPTTTPGGGVAGFNDVATSAWYADSVKYVVDKGLFGGVGNGNFAPNANMTRAMMWTVLARYMGVNTNSGSNWYEAARTWAMAQNISDGTMADGNVTREQFVTMLWRLSGEPAVGTSASFTDNGRISGYAKTAVDWAVAQGILNGYNDGSFRPQGSATRAEVAKMLTVFCQNVKLET